MAPVLELLRHELPRMGLTVYTPREDEMRYAEAARIVEERVEQGREQGREQGLTPLLRQCARKLGRLLTESERATLLSRLDTHGPERLGDVVLDLDDAALAAWITSPDAR